MILFLYLLDCLFIQSVFSPDKVKFIVEVFFDFVKLLLHFFQILIHFDLRQLNFFHFLCLYLNLPYHLRVFLSYDFSDFVFVLRFHRLYLYFFRCNHFLFRGLQFNCNDFVLLSELFNLVIKLLLLLRNKLFDLLLNVLFLLSFKLRYLLFIFLLSDPEPIFP